MPMARAAPADRSRLMPLVKGPRSLTRTLTLLPVFGLPTRRQVPKGRERCAAVNPLGLNSSPFAVRLPASSLPYQVAVTVLTAWAGVARTIRPARAKNRMMSTCFSLSLKAGIRGGKGGSSLCLGFSLGELAEAIGLPL